MWSCSWNKVGMILANGTSVQIRQSSEKDVNPSVFFSCFQSCYSIVRLHCLCNLKFWFDKVCQTYKDTVKFDKSGINLWAETWLSNGFDVWSLDWLSITSFILWLQFSITYSLNSGFILSFFSLNQGCPTIIVD